jgi:cell division protein FtsX
MNILLRNKTAYLITTVFIVLLVGLALNAYYQSRLYYDRISPKCELAAFVQKKSTDSIEVISERLLNTDGVEKLTFVDQEAAYKKAVAEEPEMKKIMITQDNPLTPYFIIKPGFLSLSFTQELSDEISQIRGIAEVRFDPNLFVVVEELRKFFEFYAIVGKILFMGGLLFVLGKYFWRWLTMKIVAESVLSSLILGAASGAIGAAVYYLLARYALPMQLVQIPAQYYLILFFSGMLVDLSFD